MNFKTILLLASMTAATASWAKSETKLPDSYAFTRGVEAVEADNYQEALEWFEKETGEHPDNGYAFLYISALHHDNLEYGKALSAINRALKKLPKKDKQYTAGAYGHRANIYLAMEDTVSALRDLASAIKLEPENRERYNHRAQIYFEQQKYDLADADYQKMVSLDPGDVMGYMGLGRNASELGRYDEAMRQFDYVIKLAPEYASGYSFRAECYIAQKKYSEAIDDIIKALSISGDYKAYYLLADMDKEALPLIKAKFQIEANKNPNEGLWYFWLGNAYENHDREKEAIAFYEQAFSRDASAGVLERIATCHYNIGEYDAALDTIDRAIDMDGTDYDFVFLKGNIFSEMGRYPEAIAEMDKYIEKYPDRFAGYYGRGWFKDEANDSDSAIEDYTMSIVLAPQYAYAYWGRGRCYDKQGDKERARADFEKVIELDSVPDPETSCAQFAYLYLGQKEKAIEFMDSLLAMDDDKRGSLYDAACLYSLMGEKERAVDYLRQAFEAGYHGIAHIHADDDFDNIREMPEFKSLLEKYSKGQGGDATERPDDLPEYTTETVEIPFTKEGGVTKVKCTINELPLHFVFDTGAADVTMSMVEANFMMKNDYIKPADIVGTAQYVDANGDISEGTVINLRKVDFGGLQLDNVRASVVRNQKAPLLLGQSVLGRLGKIEIDNSRQVLKVTHKVRK